MIGNKEERREEDKMGGKRKNGRRKGRGKRRKGTYKAAMRTVFFPVILGVNGSDEFLEVLPGFACIVHYRDFL